MTRTLSVVVPVHGNADTIEELLRRIVVAVPDTLTEILVVDDASPDGAAEVLDRLVAADGRIRVLTNAANQGQQRSTHRGLAAAAGDRVVVLDADLQDPPEAIADLLRTLDDGPWHAVFAGRRGRYSSPGRLVTGQVFKRLLSRLTLVPVDAGGFVAMDREMVDAVLALPSARPYLVGMIGSTGLAQTSIPVRRDRRPRGRSAYRARDRVTVAAGALFDAAWTWRRARAARPRRHQDVQLSYYGGPALDTKHRMHPHDSTYVRRHVDRVIAAGGIAPGDRVLDVGCGMGKYTLGLAAQGIDVEGLDISPALLERFDEADAGRFDIVRHCADLLDPPAELLGRFDVVTGFMALHHMPDVTAAFTSMGRLARPGGVIVLLEPNAYCPSYYVQITLSPSMSWRGDRGVLQMRAGSLRRAAERAGLRQVRVRRVGALPPALMNRRWGPAVEDAFDRVGITEPVRAFQIIQAVAPRT